MRIVKVKAKRAFTKTKIPGMDYVINQYVGCQHACLYCYAKFMRKWYNYGRWGDWIVVKENLPDLVKKEKVKGQVCMSSVSDPYQPIEKELMITRKILENIDEKTKLSILTKSALVLRDMDLFEKFYNIEVGLTINNFDGRIKRIVEPFSSSNWRRIDALKELHERGVRNYAFISPIIPHLIDVEELIKETKHFTDFYLFEFLNLRASVREFREWLKQNYPESYGILSDKSKVEKYVEDVVRIINGYVIPVRGIYAHYPTYSGKMVKVMD